MSEDNLYLLLTYLVFGFTLALLTLKSRSKVRTLAINLAILAAYSGLFLYNLEYHSEGGSGLVWLVFLEFSIGLHWLVNLTQLILTFTRRT